MTQTQLTAIKGIGPQTAARLVDHGIADLKSLTVSTVATLTKIPGFSEARARAILQAAKSLLGEGKSQQAPSVSDLTKETAEMPTKKKADKKPKKKKADKKKLSKKKADKKAKKKKVDKKKLSKKKADKKAKKKADKKKLGKKKQKGGKKK